MSFDSFNINTPKPTVSPAQNKPASSKSEDAKPSTPAPSTAARVGNSGNTASNALELQAQFARTQFEASQRTNNTPRFDFSNVNVASMLSPSTLQGLQSGNFGKVKDTASKAVKSELGGGKLSSGALDALAEGVAFNLGSLDDGTVG